MSFNRDPRIVKFKIWVEGKMAATWGEADFTPGENDTVLRLTPKIIIAPPRDN